MPRHLDSGEAPSRTGGGLAPAAMMAIAACVALIVALHVVDPGLDPLREMLSEYVYGHARWMFDTAVLALVAGSVAVLVASVRAGLVPARSDAVALLGVWSTSLVLIVVCKTGGTGLPLTAGAIVHGVASVAAFSALPVAVFRIGRRWRGHPQWGRHAWCAIVLSVVSFSWLVPLVVPLLGTLSSPDSTAGAASSATLPFGLIERALALTEVAALVVLAVWASCAHRRPAPVG